MVLLKVFTALILGASLALASATRTIDADTITSSDKTKSYALPSASGGLLNAANHIQEVPSGTVDGINTSFTLANTPASSASVILYLDGLALIGGGSDYSISGSAITMITAPAIGQSLKATYLK